MKELHILDSERMAYQMDKDLKNRETLSDLTKLEDHPLLKESVEKIDFKILKDIFDDFFRNYNLQQPDLDVVSKEKIYDCNFQAAGTYNGDTGVIVLNYRGFRMRVIEESLQSGLDLNIDLLIIRTYIHELVHALSKQVDVVSFGNSDDERQEVALCGFHLSSYNGEDMNGEHFFENFDEAVTERVAEMIFNEYVNRVGLFTEKELKDFDEVNTIYDDENIKMLDEMISFLIKESGMNSSEVWKKIIQGKFEGVIVISDWLDELKKIFGENYLSLLAQKHPDEMRWYLQDLEDEKFSAKYPED